MQTIASIQKAIEPIAKAHGLKRVFLFGSYARGTATENSDIDLLIEKKEPLTLLGMSNILWNAKEALHLPVDLLSAGGLSDDFKKEIEKDKVLIYEG